MKIKNIPIQKSLPELIKEKLIIDILSYLDHYCSCPQECCFDKDEFYNCFENIFDYLGLDKDEIEMKLNDQ